MIPYYDHAGITIYHGDCREILSQVTLPALDAVITDPPYGAGLYKSDKAVDCAFLFDFAPVVMIFGWPEKLIAQCVALGRVPDEWITWWPTNGRLIGMAGEHGLWREASCIAVFGKLAWGSLCDHKPSKDAIRLGGRLGITSRRLLARSGEAPRRTGDVWRDPSPGVMGNRHLRYHPNEKPLTLMVRLLWSLTTDAMIFDPLMGSGTTLLAAKETGRRAIGIEIEERWCEVAVRRLAQEVLPLRAQEAQEGQTRGG